MNFSYFQLARRSFRFPSQPICQGVFFQLAQILPEQRVFCRAAPLGTPVLHRSPALPSPFSITRFYIFFEQTITNIIESSASYISVVHHCCSFYFGDYDDNSMAPIWRDATGLCIGTVYFLL